VHAGQVLAAAARGIPVLCQKPLAPTLAEAEALVQAVGGRIRLMVHENWRFRPYYQQVAQWLHAGRLGRVTGCLVSVNSAGLISDASGRYPSVERQPFFREEARLLVAETLIHHLDLVRWLLGPLSLTAAQLHHTSEVVPGEAAATLLLRSVLDASVVVTGNLTCAGLPPRGTDRFELFGVQASAVMEGDRLRLLGPEPEEISYVREEAYQACFTAAIAHFVACLRHGKPFQTAPEDNLETLRLVEAAYRMAS
jgi:predicted dehydrogenase